MDEASAGNRSGAQRNFAKRTIDPVGLDDLTALRAVYLELEAALRAAEKRGFDPPTAGRAVRPVPRLTGESENRFDRRADVYRKTNGFDQLRCPFYPVPADPFPHGDLLYSKQSKFWTPIDFAPYNCKSCASYLTK
jgi:hypothetical protein